MKVDLTNFGTEPPESSKPSRSAQAAATSITASRNAGEDQARFSFDSTRVQALAAQVLAEPELREAKVRALQQALVQDKYSVPAGNIADAVIRELKMYMRED